MMNNISLDELIKFINSREEATRELYGAPDADNAFRGKMNRNYGATAEALRELQSLRQKLKEKDEQLDEVINKQKGTPPCARHCESTAYEIEIKQLKAKLESKSNRRMNDESKSKSLRRGSKTGNPSG